ncbi:AgmX/PglI C-terminal domain-containing protein [Chondromyces crocatus]|uniref:AgmX/PglI C-terminal domain-containing protein n=1 Tax=Chondromyces crocatus TaxID=52 RepID=A0A0K1ET20_CHOCO|nr:AgmX/PglI C-terminal domain-containing protein [Chondromyces crocatus]AKT43773.1 uncharacterized protein CMC5_080090 [Chondromyces crocatus]
MRYRAAALGLFPFAWTMSGCRPEAPAASPAEVAVIDLSAAPAASTPASSASSTEAAQDAPSDEAGTSDGKAIKEYGVIGLLQATSESPFETPTNIFGPADEGNAGGFGLGGLGLRGVGQGGGGTGEGIGLGTIGTIGRGNGTGAGYGRGAGATTGGPEVRTVAPTVKGSLPPEVIQRIIRQHRARFRHCYEVSLQKDPTLQGGASFTFVIGKEGKVTSAREATSDLGNKDVSTCVVQVIQSLVFPAPEKGGVVTVTYPLRFSSAAPAPSEKDAPPSKDAPAAPPTTTSTPTKK